MVTRNKTVMQVINKILLLLLLMGLEPEFQWDYSQNPIGITARMPLGLQPEFIPLVLVSIPLGLQPEFH